MVDTQLIFSDNQELNASGASTNVIDLGALVDDRGNALTEFGIENGQVRVLAVATAALGGTSPTVQVRLDDSADGSTFATVLTAAQLSSAPAGTELLHIVLPPNVRRYVRLYYTLGGTSPTITVWAGLVVGVQS